MFVVLPKTTCFLFLFALTTVALDLVPIPPHHPSLSQKRQTDGTPYVDDDGTLHLLDYESFYWGGNGGDNMIYANLTLFYKEEYEFIIGMERFESLLKNVTCGSDMTLEFKDESSFAQASTIWNWVNDDVNNTFVMVSRRCSNDGQREPFLVSNMHFDPQQLTVFLDIESKEWIDIAKNYTFHIGYAPAVDRSSLFERGGAPDFTMSLASDFSTNLFKQNISNLDISLDCTRCGTAGQLLVDFDLNVGIPPKLSMKVNPQDVAAFMQLTMSVTGQLTKPLEWEKTLVSIPIEGITIPHIAKIGAFLDIEVGFGIKALSGSVSAGFGAEMSLSNDAVIDVDVFHLSKGKFSGWKPAVSALPFSLGTKVQGGVQLYAQPSVSLSAVAFDHGLELSLDLKMPFVDVDFAVIASTAGVCGSKKTVGVDLKASTGVDLSVQLAKTGGMATPLWEQSLFNKAWPLFSHCYPFGPENAIELGGGSASSTMRTTTNGNISPQPTSLLSTEAPKPTFPSQTRYQNSTASTSRSPLLYKDQMKLWTTKHANLTLPSRTATNSVIRSPTHLAVFLTRKS
ncbi:hypothetical protein B0H63DRAFT_510951 [Podospora didyma]|uniref:Uncharacterized protein n=1 Tax=Podospora didyma TaxID=330526 RepID=A0AAE0NGB0_9PEZI|nr:hypothetical protein B0H63DRAFT_510951 [Podospora didyma]